MVLSAFVVLGFRFFVLFLVLSGQST